jgi:hypothetical protein
MGDTTSGTGTPDETSKTDSTPPSLDDAMQALTDHISAAVDQHARRASDAMKRTTDTGYDLAAMQRDVFDASMQVVTDSLKAVNHLTNIARAAADKR